MNPAPVIAMNFMCYMFFFYFSGLNSGSGPFGPSGSATALQLLGQKPWIFHRLYV